MRQPVLYALCCLSATIEGSLLLINMISFLMKRNILTSNPAVPTSRCTFILDLIRICILLFLALQAGFILRRKKLPLYRSSDWQTASKKSWSNVLNALLEKGSHACLIFLNGIALCIIRIILIGCQFMLHYIKHKQRSIILPKKYINMKLHGSWPPKDFASPSLFANPPESIVHCFFKMMKRLKAVADRLAMSPDKALSNEGFIPQQTRIIKQRDASKSNS